MVGNPSGGAKTTLSRFFPCLIPTLCDESRPVCGRCRPGFGVGNLGWCVQRCLVAARFADGSEHRTVRRSKNGYLPVRGRRTFFDGSGAIIDTVKNAGRGLGQTGLMCLLIALMQGCVPRAENEVVLYSAADREVATPIVAAFQRRHESIKPVATYDVESTKTVGLVTRIENEARQPRCDLFWNNEILHTMRLEKAGLLQAVSWDVPSNWPKQMRSPQSRWIAFAARARILLVNRKSLPDESQWPKSVMELADPRWQQKCAVALPLFGTTATHFTVLQSKLGSDKAKELFQQVKNNAVVLSGNKQVAQAVANGQVAFGLTDTDDALIEIDSGMPVSIVFPDQEPGQLGTLLIPNTLAVIKGCPHPVAAQALGNYLLSEDIEGRLAMSPSGNIPIRPAHPQKSRAAPPAATRYMDVDFQKASQEWETASASLREIFRGE